MTTLPPGFTLRYATWDDLQGVADLIRAVCTADGDPEDAIPPAELKTQWEGPGFNPETNAWVVINPTGTVVGYEELLVRPGHASLRGDGYVHPQFEGLGVGTNLLRALDERARLEIPKAAPDLRVFVRNFMTAEDKAGCALHENEGYQAARFSWAMRIKLESPPPAPEFPAGVEIRPFVEADQLFQVYEAVEEAFADHWGFIKIPFENWKHNFLSPEHYCPDWWFVAWDGDQVAGVSICRVRSGMGWVSSLSVRRPWRKLGLGMALLRRSFAEFYRCGYSLGGLAVDASNPTGATRLYERAGMSIETEYVCYEKELRPGREPEE